jgi:integrase
LDGNKSKGSIGRAIKAPKYSPVPWIWVVYSVPMNKRGRGRPKGSGGAAAVIDFTQLKCLLQVAERMDRATYRIQIALLLSYEIGLRASEVSKLHLCDIYAEEGSVRERLQVNGPGSRRVLPLSVWKVLCESIRSCYAAFRSPTASN